MMHIMKETLHIIPRVVYLLTDKFIMFLQSGGNVYFVLVFRRHMRKDYNHFREPPTNSERVNVFHSS